jgi:hypothetical protein
VTSRELKNLGRSATATVVVVGDAKRREQASKSAVYGWLNELHDAGLLDKVEGQRGRSPAVWRLTTNSLKPKGVALPPVEKICP